MNDVADLLEDQGQLEGSEALRRECAESRRTVLGETHPDTLATMLDEAELLLRGCLHKRRAELGEAHSHTQATVEALAEVLQDT
ncbi:hypothetical protein AK812_SmicGene5266 [Symbiodinium microadriaticum]|uniref:Kinesin light chain n=1 Tax=Symbiodinium microadriaticum TaxID=2951 RepID=A0A1Q9EU57_SYMMI|nr:hypothetical protein AK812_SmicGene5266 [Symbiodinium microadriaticum]